MVLGCTSFHFVNGDRLFRLRAALGSDELLRGNGNYQFSYSNPCSRSKTSLLVVGGHCDRQCNINTVFFFTLLNSVYNGRLIFSALNPTSRHGFFKPFRY
jgi:hypothetical protein